MDISVVIPCMNGERTLGTQLDALATQDVQGAMWEVVVADNGSTDHTRELVLARAKEFPVPLRLVDASASSGAAFARNVGALTTSGQWLAFCDADDRVANTWLSAIARNRAGNDALGGPLRILSTPFDPDAPFLPSSAYHSGPQGPSISSCNFAVRREVFLGVGGFDWGFLTYGGEDSEICIRLNKIAARFAYVADMTLYFRATPPGLRALTKVFYGSLADPLIWKRHPDIFPPQQMKAQMKQQIKAAPATAVRNLRERKPLPAVRALVRAGAYAYVLMKPSAATARIRLIAEMTKAGEHEYP